MAAKSIHFRIDARRRMLRGMNHVADAVGATVGPKGRTVLLDRKYGPPVVTRDGFTVAREMDFDQRVENMAAQLIKETAARAHHAVGDGTSTATLLARAIFADGLRLVAAGHDPMSLRRGIEKGVTRLLEELERLSRPLKGLERLTQVATLSANGDGEVGDLVARALDKVGEGGVVSVEDGRGLVSELVFLEGMQIDHGWLSPVFITDPVRGEAVLDDALVFLYDGQLTELKQVLPILGLATGAKKSILVIADTIEGVALQTLTVNRQRGTIRCAAVRAFSTAESRREVLGDVAAVTGARVMGADLGLSPEAATEADLGRARQIVVDRDSTTILDGKGRRRDIENRISYLRHLIRKADDPKRERLEDRLAALVGGIATIRVGGVNEIDVTERKSRLDDSICATRAALAEGVVPGGGATLLRMAAALDGDMLPEEERPAIDILRRALEEPIRRIAANAGTEPSVVIDRVRRARGSQGFNAKTLEVEDLAKAGILDPVKVVRVALTSAASVAALLLTAEASVSESPFVVEKDYLDPPTPDMTKARPRSGQLKG